MARTRGEMDAVDRHAPKSSLSPRWKCKRSGLHYAYFPYFERKPETKDWSWPRFLLQKASVESRWQTVFENFYRSEYRKVAWARMAEMLRYDSFWEYKVLVTSVCWMAWSRRNPMGREQRW
jgi:hypothetical protein